MRDRLSSFCRLLGSFIVIFTTTLEKCVMFVISSAREVGAHSGIQHQTHCLRTIKEEDGVFRKLLGLLQTHFQHVILEDPGLYC